MRNVLNKLLDAITLLAMADLDYWVARQQFTDPDLASLLAVSLIPGLDPARRIEAACGSSSPVWRSEEEEAVEEAIALLVAARRDVVRSN